MSHDFVGHARRRCEIVKGNFPDNWEDELLKRFNVLLERNNESKVAGGYDKAEIEEIKLLLNITEYKILDKNGIEMPDHYSGRRRNYNEVKSMADSLNIKGEHKPYTIVGII